MILDWSYLFNKKKKKIEKVGLFFFF